MAVHSMASHTTSTGTSASPWRTWAWGRMAAGPRDSFFDLVRRYLESAGDSVAG